MLKDFLIGAQLTQVDEKGFIVVKDGRTYRFDYIVDDGDCGYANIKGTLLISSDKIENNPIITKVIEITSNNDDLGVTCLITLFGESQPIAVLDADAGSGSGWQYGACVIVECELAEIKEAIVSW